MVYEGLRDGSAKIHVQDVGVIELVGPEGSAGLPSDPMVDMGEQLACYTQGVGNTLF